MLNGVRVFHVCVILSIPHDSPSADLEKGFKSDVMCKLAS